MTEPRPSRSAEATFAAALLLGAGVALVSVAFGIDRLRGAAFSFGPLQAGALAAGLVALLGSIAILRSSRARRWIVRLWPFGSDGPARPRHVLAFALWLAVTSGILEAALRLALFASGRRWGTFHPHSFWMIPLVDAVTAAILAGALALFGWLGFRHLGSPRLAAFLLLLLAVGAPLAEFHTELRWISVVLLTLGTAYQGSAWIVAREEGFSGWVRRSIVPISVLLVLAGLAPTVRQAWSERAALAESPEPQDSMPNVLLVILDTVRAQNLSLYGYGRATTPGLEHLAAEATVYDQAFAPSSWTLPSHASFFTGVPPHRQSSTTLTPLDDALPTLAEAFTEHGYYTLAVVANHDNAYPHTGLDRGFARFDAHVVSLWEMLQASSCGAAWDWALKRIGVHLPTRKDADMVNERFLANLDRRGRRPFFAFLNYYDAHYPFDDPLPPTTRIEGWEATKVEIVGKMDPYVTRWVDAYDREIAFLDDRVGWLISELDRLGVLDGTIVVVASDHGEEFTEHGYLGHGFNVYAPTILVPLLVYRPGIVPQGVRVARPVALQDLPHTLFELAGLSGPSPFPGTNLLSVPDSAGVPASPVLSELGVAEGSNKVPSRWNYRSIVWRGLHYIRNPDDSEEVYDLAEDPWELRDLTTVRADLPLAEFRAALSSLIETDRP